ncbi:putative recombination protein RecR [Pillotina sp. SPG140]|jgi:recombination protein RecR
MANSLERLAGLFSKLPGIGKKTANRLVYYVLNEDPHYAQQLAAELSSLHASIKRCSICGCFTETDPCSICTDENRDRRLLCVVERPQDVQVIEESREFTGCFHVLGGLIAPLEGIYPSDLPFMQLIQRVQTETVREVILALNPTVEGDTTALYVQNILKGSGTVVSRLASGLPIGGDLEYTDRLTLARSLRARVAL